MRQFELKPNCPFCGNMFSNYENIIVRANLDMKSEEAETSYEEPDIIIGRRWYETPIEEIGPSQIDETLWNKLVTKIRRKTE